MLTYFLSGLKSFVKKIVEGVGNIAEFAWRGIWTGVKKIGRAIGEVPALSTAISVGLGILCNGAAAACVSAFNAVMTAANGGTISQALTGAAVGYVAGLASGGLGQAFGGGFVRNAGAAMLVGGAFTKAQGGKFIEGVKGAVIGIAAGGIATGLRNAYNAGANSLGAALDHVKWAFEDMMLPSAEASRGIVTIEDIHPDGSVYGSTGPIETMAPSAPLMNGCIALPGSCVVPNSGTGWSPRASYGDIYNRDTMYRGHRNLNIAKQTFKVGSAAVGGWAAITGKTVISAALLGQEFLLDYGFGNANGVDHFANAYSTAEFFITPFAKHPVANAVGWAKTTTLHELSNRD